MLIKVYMKVCIVIRFNSALYNSIILVVVIGEDVVMGAFDIFYKKEKMVRKTIQIDNELYNKLNYLSDNVYDTSTNMLINASIGELIKTKNIKSYKKEKGDILEKHTLLIRESFVIALDELKDKYDMPIYKLVNMAIKNALNELG